MFKLGLKKPSQILRLFNDTANNRQTFLRLWLLLCCRHSGVVGSAGPSGHRASASGTAVSCLPGLQQKTEREWLFEILRQGMRDRHCYELCARRGVFHIVLSFFNSPLCDDEAQVGGAQSV